MNFIHTADRAIEQSASSTDTPSGGALRVYGNLSTLELAPVLLAASKVDEGEVILKQGGILSLYGEEDASLPNLRAHGISHVATNSETQGLRYSFDHPDLRIIFTVAEGLYRIVARRSAGIVKLADLRGKRIGTMPRTSSAFYLDQMLKRVGLSDEDVVVVPFVAGSSKPLKEMRNALINGDIDAVTIWEPEMQRCQEALGGDDIEFFEASGYREQFCLYSTQSCLSDPFWRSRIVAFVKALVVASQELRRQPDKAQSLVAQAAGFDLQTVVRSWCHHAYPGTLLPNLLNLLIEQEPWVARETGRTVREPGRLAQLIDASILEEATS